MRIDFLSTNQNGTLNIVDFNMILDMKGYKITSIFKILDVKRIQNCINAWYDIEILNREALFLFFILIFLKLNLSEFTYFSKYEIALFYLY